MSPNVQRKQFDSSVPNKRKYTLTNATSIRKVNSNMIESQGTDIKEENAPEKREKDYGVSFGINGQSQIEGAGAANESLLKSKTESEKAKFDEQREARNSDHTHYHEFLHPNQAKEQQKNKGEE